MMALHSTSTTRLAKACVRTGAFSLLALLLTACSEPRSNTPSTATGDAAAPAQDASQAPATLAWGNDDPNAPQPDPSPLGIFHLWEDIEGGRVCRVELQNVRTIGGYTFSHDEDCLRALDVPDAEAWFPTDDGTIVIIDATRKVLVRLPRLENGDYRADRSGEGKMSLNLTRS